MRGSDLARSVPGGLRVRRWRGDPSVALVLTTVDRPAVRAGTVSECLEALAQQGRRMAVTGALAPSEQDGFLAAGFRVREHLHLLVHDLTHVRELAELSAQRAVSPRLRRARRADRPSVLAVDAAAFDDFWRLDDPGLDEAQAATPVSRVRVAEATAMDVAPGVAGYSVCGRAGPRGYLQRLAVLPSAQRAGVGTALVVDGLSWMRRRGAQRAVVNTQEGNTSALALYQRLGFERQAEGLAVLTYDLTDPTPYAPPR